MERRSKSIVISLDGSQNSWRSLDYISLIYGPTHDLDLTLLHILPSLPPVFADDKIIDWQIRQKRMAVSEKNRLLAERILAEAKENLIKKGFDEERIRTVSQEKGISTAKDICRWANAKQADAILLTKRGSTDFETFVLGGVSSKLVEYCVNRPVWIVGGNVRSNKVLICVDSSENALRAVDHARFMLSGTVCSLTIFHSARHLKHYLPEEVLEGAEELQKLWKDEEGTIRGKGAVDAHGFGVYGRTDRCEAGGRIPKRGGRYSPGGSRRQVWDDCPRKARAIRSDGVHFRQRYRQSPATPFTGPGDLDRAVRMFVDKTVSKAKELHW
jgi:nucleotide-binding universal stress UspA family protein